MVATSSNMSSPCLALTCLINGFTLYVVSSFVRLHFIKLNHRQEYQLDLTMTISRNTQNF